MFRESQEVQITLNDRMLFINDQTRKAIDLSRAKLVGDIIYPNVDETKFAGLLLLLSWIVTNLLSYAVTNFI